VRARLAIEYCPSQRTQPKYRYSPRTSQLKRALQLTFLDGWKISTLTGRACRNSYKKPKLRVASRKMAELDNPITWNEWGKVDAEFKDVSNSRVEFLSFNRLTLE
jgi:hypothetical protein